MRSTTARIVLALSAASVAPLAAQTVDAVNPGVTLTEQLYGASAVGWYYTPSSSFFLTAIKTRFATSPTFDSFANLSRQVSVELWTDRAANGGSLLRSATFDSQLALNQFGGGAFSAFLLQGGVQYFIGFRNVDGLGRNTTDDPASESLGSLYYSVGDPALATYASLQNLTKVYNPTLELQGRLLDTTVTPEPVTMLLMATGLVGVGGVAAARRRRQQKQA